MRNSTREKVTKAALAMVLSVSMVWSSVPVTAFADEVEAAQEPAPEVVVSEDTELKVEESVVEDPENEQVFEGEDNPSEAEPGADEVVATDDAASAEEELVEDVPTAEVTDETKAEDDEATKETEATQEDDVAEQAAEVPDDQVLDSDALTSAASSSVAGIYTAVYSNATSGSGVFRENYNKSDKSYWVSNLSYTLFDLDFDGTPEFFVANGTFTANMVIDVFTIRSDSAYHLGKVPFGTLYGNGKGELYVTNGRMGVSWVYLIKKSENSVTYTQVKRAEETAGDYNGTKQVDAYLKSKETGKLETSKVISGSIKNDLMDLTAYYGYHFFPDVPSNHWAQKVISQACSWGIFSGYSSGKFGPSDTVTRGQIAVALWNMAGKPNAKSGAKNFPDVKSSAYYYKAVHWASSWGIVSGYKNGKFGPNDNITREQLAVMIRNYAQKSGVIDTTYGQGDYKKFSDASKISSYARTAIGWCARRGIMSGSNNKVNPKNNATRAEAAKMLVKFYSV